MDNELVRYVREQKGKMTEQDLMNNLLKAGWPREQVDKALLLAAAPDIPLPPQAPRPPSSHGMWDTFENILLFISLYVSATSFTLIIHFFIDKWLPNAVSTLYPVYDSYRSWNAQLLRGYLSALIVSYPLFLFFFLRVTKRTIQNPILRNLRSRKTLIYFTLVMTFIIMISNVISIVYNFLNGNTTVSFVLHFFATILVSGSIFAYYLKQIEDDRKVYA